LILLLIRQKTM